MYRLFSMKGRREALSLSGGACERFTNENSKRMSLYEGEVFNAQSRI